MNRFFRNTISLLTIVLLCINTIVAQTIRFQSLTIKDGLSQSATNCIFQDNLGYVWIGTQDGLNKFDGIDFKVYKHLVNNNESLSSSYINCITADSSTNLIYIGTQNGGVNIYNPSSNKFKQLSNIPNLEDATISALLIHQGKLYIGTSKMGLYVYDIENKKHKKFGLNVKFPAQKIVRLSLVNENIWIGTEGQGLVIFDTKTDTYSHFTNNPNVKESLINNNVSKAIEIAPNKILLGTNSGLNIVDMSKAIPSFKVIRPKSKDLKLNSVEDIVRQNDSVYWIATNGEGLFKLQIKKENQYRFFNFQSNELNKYAIPHNIVNQAMVDYAGTIWVVTQDGLAFFDPEKQGFQSFVYEYGNSKSILDKTVWSIFQKDSMIWVGTRQGVTAIDRKNDKYFQYPFSSSNLNQPNNNSVYYVTEGPKGNIWTCTSSGVFILNVNATNKNLFEYQKINFRENIDPWDDDQCYHINFGEKNYAWISSKEGIARLDINSIVPKFYAHDINNPNSVAAEACRLIYIDKSGQKWAAFSGSGFAKIIDIESLDGYNVSLKYYQNDPENNNSLSNNTVLSMYEEPKGTLWLSTYGGGLNKFVIESELFESFTEEDGLANNATYGITGSNSENTIWISTNFGLSKFNYQTKTFENYLENDGLLSNEFNNGAYFQSESGELFFGGIAGFNAFYPNKIKSNDIEPRVVITDLLIANKPFFNEYPELGVISYLNEVNLKYKQNNITLKFSALHYTFPKGNKYKVMLDGVDSEPTLLNNLQQINYSNLSPGRYTFKVWACNSDGKWTEKPTELVIIVAAPYWSTWWFISICVILLAGIVYVFYIYRIKSMKSQKERLAFLVEKRTKTITEQKEQLEKNQEELKKEKEKSDKLLLNILPAETVEELKNKGKTKPRYYRMVTVLFTDIKGFTQIAEDYKPTDLVKRLDNLFRVIDSIIEKHQLEKIKTIGDAYMAAGGVPLRDKENPINSVLAALEIQSYMKKEFQKSNEPDAEAWELRIGLHTGDIIAGVIGTKRIAYDIWGNTVNVANRMEMSGEAGKVNVSGTTYEYIKPYFDCTYRGKIPAKNKGEIDMYFVEGIKPHLARANSNLIPNKKFKEYVNLHIYSSINYRKAERHIMKILKAELSPNLHYHGIHHTYDVVDAAERLAIMEGVLDEDIFVLKSAATYHDAGFVEQYEKNEPVGARMASEILPLYGYTEEQVGVVHELIYATIIPHNPQNRLQQIICDADLDYLGRDDFHQISDTLRRELRDHGKINSDRLWDELQIKFLEAHKYFTKSAIKLRQEKKLKHIEEIKQRLKENNYKD